MDANGATLPRAFRYTLEMKTKVHAFLPKQLADGADPKDLRSSVLGAFWLPNLEKIPKSPTASIIWEAAKHFGDHSNTMFSFYDDLLFFGNSGERWRGGARDYHGCQAEILPTVHSHSSCQISFEVEMNSNCPYHQP